MGTVFLVGYAAFEIPTGHLGDRIGARRVLTRIVLWWSAFTALTGAVSLYPVLLLVRFLFGAGEAGAFPNAAVAISRWFPPETRGRAFGVFTMFTQIGGAISPLLVVPIQARLGWRASFFIFGCLGVAWAAVWFWTFRDHPPSELPPAPAQVTTWRPLLRSRVLWTIMAVTFTYVYAMSFYQTWIHTYLVKGRGFHEEELWMSSLPYVCGAAANLAGGLGCDALAKVVGVPWSRRGVGMAGACLAAASMAAATFSTGHVAIIVALSLAYAGITLQQPPVLAACLDIGGLRGGAVVGFMNTAAAVGAALSSVVFGYIVKATGDYDAPLIPMAVLLAAGVALWLKIDVTQRIEE